MDIGSLSQGGEEEEEEDRKNGRTEKFHRLKKENREELSSAKKYFYNKECEKLTSAGSHVVSFNALKHINVPSKPKPWQPQQMYPEKQEDELLEYMADFFNMISVEFKHLTNSDLPETFDRPI